MILTSNNLYLSFFAPPPSYGTIYNPGFCWCYNDKYSNVYELRWVPNFIDQIMAIEFAISAINNQKIETIYTGQRHFPWTINNAFHTQRKSRWRLLGENAQRLKTYLDANNIIIDYPKRGDIHDTIYRYGLYRVASTLGKIVLPGHTKSNNFEPNSTPPSYNIQKLETILKQKGIISEVDGKV
jgi:hypothetical protein